MKITEMTIPGVFRENRAKYGKNILVKYWKNETWEEITWADYGETVRCIASGLLELGSEKGDGVCVMCRTRAEWGMVDLAVLSIGCVTGCIYPTLLGKDASYIMKDMDAEIVFVDSASQRDEILKFRNDLPLLKKVVIIDDDPGSDHLCMSFDELISLGEGAFKNNGKVIDERIDSLTQKDVATVVYTSGTTGTPKGAVHDHRSIIYTAVNNVYPFEPGMVDLSYLPMAHVFERFGGFYGVIYMGTVVIAYYRGDMKGLIQDFQDIKPNVNRTAPRLLEKVYSTVMATVAAKSAEEREKFHYDLGIAKKIRVDEELYGIKADDASREAFTMIMKEKPFAKIHLILGNNMKFFYGGGAPIPKEVTEFFFAIGIPVYELYGTTETIGTVTNYPGRVKAGTIGVPFPMVGWPGEPGETRISPDGEIENRGPNVLLEYLNRPDETAAAFTDDGWFRTGDLGVMDSDGFITITGRKKDIIVTSGGKNIAPQRIENHIKESGYFSQVLVYGDNRKYLTALFALDPMSIFPLALQLGIDLSDIEDEEEKYRRVATDEKTFVFVKSVVDEKNRDLFKQEQIVRFILLERDLKPELDEVTPTMKLKKGNVINTFRERLDALYE